MLPFQILVPYQKIKLFFFTLVGGENIVVASPTTARLSHNNPLFAKVVFERFLENKNQHNVRVPGQLFTSRRSSCQCIVPSASSYCAKIIILHWPKHVITTTVSSFGLCSVFLHALVLTLRKQTKKKHTF